MLKINSIRTLLLLTFFSLFLSGCSTLGWLKFWGDDEEVELPAELYDIKQELTLSIKWKSRSGDGENLGRILPVIIDDKAFIASSTGEVQSLGLEKGKKIWSRKTKDPISGALGEGFKKLFYGTLDGEVVSLSSSDGKEEWRTQTSSEVLSPPATNGNIVAVHSTDGSISGLDFKTGTQRWIHQSSSPRLSLRGTSIPFFEQGFIFTGFANGKVSMIYPDTGSVRWEVPVAINEGKSELERIVDIDGKLIVYGGLLFSASFQGNLTALDLKSGRPVWQEKISTSKDLSEARSRIISVDDKSIVRGYGASSGVLVWQQEDLKLRKVSSPVTIKSNVVVGDYEGYLHILSSKDGSFLARKKVSNKPIVEIVSEGDQLLVLDETGLLIFLLIG